MGRPRPFAHSRIRAFSLIRRGARRRPAHRDRRSNARRGRRFARSFVPIDRRTGRTDDRTTGRGGGGRGRGVDTVKPSNGRRALDDGRTTDDDRTTTMAAREMEALTIASMASRDAVRDANERNE